MTNLVNETETSSSSSDELDSSIKNNLGQQDFLHLMATQIQTQELMQSRANSDILSQLAQFGTNGGVAKMHESLQQMATSLQSNQALQASALVGRKVLVNSDTFQLGTEAYVKIAMDIPPGFSKLSASIYSEFGSLIKTVTLGQPEPGFFQFCWDCIGCDNHRVKEGRYKVKVRAVYEGKEVSLKTMTSANVDSVSLGQNGEGLKLNVAGIGPISLDQVRQIFV